MDDALTDVLLPLPVTLLLFSDPDLTVLHPVATASFVESTAGLSIVSSCAAQDPRGRIACCSCTLCAPWRTASSSTPSSVSWTWPAANAKTRSLKFYRCADGMAVHLHGLTTLTCALRGLICVIVAQTAADGLTAEEGKQINKSLSALGNVISALTGDLHSLVLPR